MTDNTDPPAPAPQSVICAGVPWQRDPKVISGTDDTDVEYWSTSYERMSAHNKQDDAAKLTNVLFYLTGVSQLWLHNHEIDIPSWSPFKTSFTQVFGRPAVRKLCAGRRLRAGAQQTRESFTTYIEEVVKLCKSVNAAVPDADKLQHILKSIDDGAFPVLLARNPRTVSEVVALCQSNEELKKQRILTWLPLSTTDPLSSLVAVSAHSPLLQQIQDLVREQVALQLSLVPFTQEPSFRLPTMLRTVIAEEVAQAVAVAHYLQPVTTPLPIIDQ